MFVWWKNRQTDQNRGSRNRHTHKYSWLLFEKEQRQCNGAKTVFSANGAGATGHHMQKNEPKHSPYTIQKINENGSEV